MVTPIKYDINQTTGTQKMSNGKVKQEGSRTDPNVTFSEKDYLDFLGPDQVNLNINLTVKPEKPSMLNALSDGLTWLSKKANEIGTKVAENIAQAYQHYISGEAKKVDKDTKEVMKELNKGNTEVAGDKAKAALIKRTENSKVMTSQQKAAKIVILESLGSLDAVNTLAQLNETLKQANANKNVKVIVTCTSKYTVLIKDHPELVKIEPKLTKDASAQIVVGAKIVAGAVIDDSKKMMSKLTNMEDAKKAKENAYYTEVVENGNTCAIETLSREEYSADIEAEGIVENAKSVSNEIKTAALSLIQVAEAKGYKLDNFAQLASIAGVVGGGSAETEVITATDVVQFNALSKVQKALSDLFAEVSNMLRENREENGKLDEASAKRSLEKKMDELKQIEREFIKTLQENKSQNIKLENKLHAEITALSYLVQNPGQITQKLVDDIINEVKKIKLQIR